MARIPVRTRVLAAATALLLPLALAGCSRGPEAPVAVGTNIWPGYEPGYIADRRGLFGEADVTLRQFRSATEVLRAFRNQSINVAAVTLDEALMLAGSGIPIRVILVADVSNGADAIMARPPIASVKDLAGKRIGVENSALGDYVLGRALQLHQVPDRNVEQVHLTVDETVEAYRRNQVDAVVTFEPFKSQLANLGASKIFDSTEIPNEIIDVLVVRSEFAEDNPEVLKHVVAGWLAGARLLNRREPTAFAEVARRLELSNDDLGLALQELKLPSLAENRALLANRSGQVQQAARKLIPMLEQRNATKITVRPEDLITPDFLPEAEAK